MASFLTPAFGAARPARACFPGLAWLGKAVSGLQTAVFPPFGGENIKKDSESSAWRASFPGSALALLRFLGATCPSCAENAKGGCSGAGKAGRPAPVCMQTIVSGILAVLATVTDWLLQAAAWAGESLAAPVRDGVERFFREGFPARVNMLLRVAGSFEGVLMPLAVLLLCVVVAGVVAAGAGLVYFAALGAEGVGEAAGWLLERRMYRMYRAW